MTMIGDTIHVDPIIKEQSERIRDLVSENRSLHEKISDLEKGNTILSKELDDNIAEVGRFRDQLSAWREKALQEEALARDYQAKCADLEQQVEALKSADSNAWRY